MAIASAAAGKECKTWRSMVFPLLAALFSLAGWFLLEGLTEGLMPWVIIGCPGCSPDFNPELRRWHGAVHGALVGILFSGSLLALLRRPRTKPLLLQFYLLGHLIFLVGLSVWLWQPLMGWGRKPSFFVLSVVVLGLLAATYPGRRTLLDFTRTRPMSRPLLAVTLLAVLALAPGVWQHFLLQVQSQGETGRWAESIDLALILVVAGLLAATRRPGWRELGIITGLAYLYLAAAALAVPDQPGSWGLAGGIAAIIGGLAYIAATVVETRLESSDLAQHLPVEATAVAAEARE